MTQAIQFIFEVNNPDPENDVSDFSFGHMTLMMGDESISSKAAGEGSMMLFVSLSVLLNGVAEMGITGKNVSVFDATDSHFGFEVHRTSRGRVRVLYRGRLVGEADLKEFMQALWQSASQFLDVYRETLPTMRRDLDDDLSTLKEAINAYQPPEKKHKKNTPGKLRY